MFKQQLLATLLLFATTAALKAQNGAPVRYKDLVFPNVEKTADLSYGPGETKDEKKAHLFDLYQPKGDKATARPLIIWMHGGGFKYGSKNAKGVEIWSETFAQRGYVCVSINYTLSKHYPFLHVDEFLRSSYYAVQDARQAVAFFKKNYKEYNIDPDKIILGGNSAGGMIALQTAYSSNVELAKLAALPDSVAFSKQTEVTKVAGVISYWGAIYNLDWLKNARVPIVCVHGSEDRLVPLTHKDNPLYGSLSIHQKADELKIPNSFKLFKGYSHELQSHFNPIFGVSKKTKGRWLEAGQYTADFLYTAAINK
ncbi:alpha/beta hydrolase [Mucilaginibacter glaciei]|uniref:Alpha/beta hydrolase n=1 Tax=Mucilaginibacter glaciei TaxID=2772109 RepID=A0A926NM00_9SPHI|nr:alpha/beta hydrolase [Mucilaginibacter glaciei]MBD1391668.1 alpha/beta hydrolase [Mucilaginibacter glaciei]